MTVEGRSFLIGLLEERTGQRLEEERAWRVETALAPVMRDHGLADIRALAAAIRAESDDVLAAATIDALLNHETSFYRDRGVLDTVEQAIAALHSQKTHRHVRVWSAGCSTGQEPLSLAMLCSRADYPMPEIHATDVSHAAIARARSGRYNQFEIQRGLPVRDMMDWFEADGGDWVAKQQLLRAIRFRTHNLIEGPLPGQFDVILCRNVLLYLSLELRRQVVASFARALRPGGLLMLGAGETLIGQTDAFVLSGRFRSMYERLPNGASAAGKVAN